MKNVSWLYEKPHEERSYEREQQQDMKKGFVKSLYEVFYEKGLY